MIELRSSENGDEIMSTEYELYEANVPHGTMVLGFGDWTSAQSTITVTTATGMINYISSVEFIVDDAASISAGSIDLAGGNFSLSLGATNPFESLYAHAEKSTLQLVSLDGTNNFMVGEIRFMPPEPIVELGTFTIIPNGLTLGVGTTVVMFVVKGWTDTAT